MGPHCSAGFVSQRCLEGKNLGCLNDNQEEWGWECKGVLVNSLVARR
jgi:hypothetical protein